jgi:phosphoribosylformylglycinamidine synthase
MRSGLGVEVAAGSEPGADAFVFLWSESAGRVVVSVEPSKAGALEALCASHGVSVRRIGTVTENPVVTLTGVFGGTVSVPVADLRDASEGTLPRLFG